MNLKAFVLNEFSISMLRLNPVHLLSKYKYTRNIIDIKNLSIDNVDIVPCKKTPTHICILLSIGKPQILIYHISSLIWWEK